MSEEKNNTTPNEINGVNAWDVGAAWLDVERPDLELEAPNEYGNALAWDADWSW